MPLRAKITTTTTTKMAATSEDSLGRQLEKAVEEGRIPHGVVFAATGDGELFLWSLAAGVFYG